MEPLFLLTVDIGIGSISLEVFNLVSFFNRTLSADSGPDRRFVTSQSAHSSHISLQPLSLGSQMIENATGSGCSGGELLGRGIANSGKVAFGDVLGMFFALLFSWPMSGHRDRRRTLSRAPRRSCAVHEGALGIASHAQTCTSKSPGRRFGVASGLKVVGPSMYCIKSPCTCGAALGGSTRAKMMNSTLTSFSSPIDFGL